MGFSSNTLHDHGQPEPNEERRRLRRKRLVRGTQGVRALAGATLPRRRRRVAPTVLVFSSKSSKVLSLYTCGVDLGSASKTKPWSQEKTMHQRGPKFEPLNKLVAPFLGQDGQGREEETDRRTWTENGSEEGEAEESHIRATYHDHEHQESAVQELTTANALPMTTRRTTGLQLLTVEHIELTSDMPEAGVTGLEDTSG